MLKEGPEVEHRDEISFVFVVLIDNSQKIPESTLEVKTQEIDSCNKKRTAEELAAEKEAQDKKEKEHKEIREKITNLAEEFECGICYMIMHQAVSLMPCLHTYCGGCFSDWL